MGYSQVVRPWSLAPICVGSNPSIPASNLLKLLKTINSYFIIISKWEH